MRTLISIALLVALLSGLHASAQDNAAPDKALTPYSLVEVGQLLDGFKSTYKKKKVPQEDAINLIEGMKDAYRYFDSKGDEAPKAEIKAKGAIVSLLGKGLFARNRARINVECARALGAMPSKESGKQLLRWMDAVVLDAKAPNSAWVEYGFRSLAWVGGTDNKTLDFVRGYATGKHVEITVAAQALMAMGEWRSLKGSVRREWFNKVNQYLGGLWSAMRGSDAKKKGQAESKYNAVKDNGLKTLTLLSGEATAFGDPDQAMVFWKANKKRKWEDYVGPRFRKKAGAQKPSGNPAEKPAEKPADEPAK